MAKKMGLGRGLSAILPDVEEVVESVDQVSENPAPVPADAVVELSVGDIDPNRNQLYHHRRRTPLARGEAGKLPDHSGNRPRLGRCAPSGSRAGRKHPA